MKKFVLIMAGLLCVCALNAAEKRVFALEEILDPGVASELRRERKLSRMAAVKGTPPRLEYFPRTEFGEKAPFVWNAEKPPSFAGESLYLIRKKTPENDIEKASVVLRAISTMEGIQYYSNTWKKIDTLYPVCHMIDNPVTRNRIPDLLGTVENKQYYFFQKDNSLGNCVFTIDFLQTEIELSNLSTNLDPIRPFLFTAVKAENLKIYVVITDVGTDLLMYVVVQSLYPASPLNESIMSRSFASRIDAVAKWFDDNYQKAR